MAVAFRSAIPFLVLMVTACFGLDRVFVGIGFSCRQLETKETHGPIGHFHETHS